MIRNPKIWGLGPWTKRPHRLQPRSEVSSEKANFNGGFVVRIHKHFSWGHKRSLIFVGIQEVSARRVRRELINHSLYLFA